MRISWSVKQRTSFGETTRCSSVLGSFGEVRDRIIFPNLSIFRFVRGDDAVTISRSFGEIGGRRRDVGIAGVLVVEG
jgi:hypothetical protein